MVEDPRLREGSVEALRRIIKLEPEAEDFLRSIPAPPLEAGTDEARVELLRESFEIFRAGGALSVEILLTISTEDAKEAIDDRRLCSIAILVKCSAESARLLECDTEIDDCLELRSTLSISTSTKGERATEAAEREAVDDCRVIFSLSVDLPSG